MTLEELRKAALDMIEDAAARGDLRGLLDLEDLGEEILEDASWNYEVLTEDDR